LAQNLNLSPGSEVGQITLPNAQVPFATAMLRSAPAYTSLPLIEMSGRPLPVRNHVIDY
jgi:hypothetical protein